MAECFLIDVHLEAVPSMRDTLTIYAQHFLMQTNSEIFHFKSQK